MWSSQHALHGIPRLRRKRFRLCSRDRKPLPPVNGLPADLGLADLRRTAQAQVAWLWQGSLAPGSITLLTSQCKLGKTTLVAVMLKQVSTAGTASRGSGALSGFVDILIKMDWDRRGVDDRHRPRAYSRYEETPR